MREICYYWLNKRNISTTRNEKVKKTTNSSWEADTMGDDIKIAGQEKWQCKVAFYVLRNWCFCFLLKIKQLLPFYQEWKIKIIFWTYPYLNSMYLPCDSILFPYFTPMCLFFHMLILYVLFPSFKVFSELMEIIW